MARLPLVSPVDRALFLKAQPYLEGLPSSVLTVLASYTQERQHSKGSLVREPDSPVDRIIFLANGGVELFEPDGSGTASRAIAAPGAIGLAHHFARAVRTPGVRASVDTLCLEIATTDLDQILEDHFALVLRMAATSCYQARLTLQALGSQRPDEVGFAEHETRDTPVEIDLVQRLALAKRAPLLHGTNLTVWAEMIRGERPMRVAADEAVWRTGDPVDRMVLVLDGCFRSEGDFGSGRAPSGAILGAWEILSDEPHFEGWVAEVPSRTLSIQREIFTDLLEDHIELARTYLQRVSQKMIEGWDTLARIELEKAPPSVAATAVPG